MPAWNGAAAAEKLAALMEEELPAVKARSALRHLVKDDALYDGIARTIRKNEQTDVRPLVAVSIDEWLDWLPASELREAWDEDAKVLLSDIVLKFTDADLFGLLPRRVEEKTLTAARKAGFLMGIGTVVEVVQGTAPGTYVVRDCNLPRIVRVEILGGRVHMAPSENTERLYGRYFPTLH